jgi:membrane protein implicated in regulation of membrane protease activity
MIQSMQTTTPFFWVALGLALVIAEIFSLTLILLFFGIGALVVAIGKYMGLNNLPLEISIFATLGLAGLLFFRKKVKKGLLAENGIHFETQQPITLSGDVPAKGEAHITHQGSSWTAVNESDHVLKKGSKVFIARTEGVKLILKAE